MKKQLVTKIMAFGLSWLTVAAGVFGCRKAGDYLVRNDLAFLHGMPATPPAAEDHVGASGEPLTPHGSPVADAMLMLMGSISDRVLQCADLYAAGAAPEVVLVEENVRARSELSRRGVHIEGSTEVAIRFLTELGVPGGQITLLTGEATSTRMEAETVRDWLRDRPGTDTLILVSSSYHMRRASMIFRKAVKSLDHPVEIYCSPSEYTGFRSDTWWKRKEDIQVVFFEYLKMANFLLFDRWKL